MKASAALLVLLAAAAAPARADDDVAAVKQAWIDLDYARCKDKALGALGRPASRAGRVDAYRYLGLCQAALGETDEARAAFAHMLGVDRDAKLPDGLSPRFTSSFREAKGALVGADPLGIALVSEVVDGGTRTVRVQLTDPDGLVARVAWRGEAGVLSPPVRAAPRLELEVPAGSAVDVIGLDKAQGEVVVLTLPSPAAAAAAPPPVAVAAADEGASPWLWVAVGTAAVVLVSAAAAGGIALALAPPSSVTLKSEVVFGE